MTYFSIIPFDLVGLLLSDLSIGGLLTLFQSDPLLLPKIEKNSYLVSHIANKFGIDLSIDDRRKAFRKFLCALKYGMNKDLLSRAIKTNSALLVNYLLADNTKNNDFELSLFEDDLTLGKLGNREMINSIVEFFRPRKGDAFIRDLNRTISIAAAGNGNIELMEKYLYSGTISLFDAFGEAVISENLTTLKYINDHFHIPGDLVVDKLYSLYDYGKPDSFKILDWMLSDPKIGPILEHEFNSKPYFRELLLQRHSAFGSIEDIAKVIREGARDFPRALDIAAQYGRTDVINYLLSNFKLEKRSISRAIDEAAMYNHQPEAHQIEIIKILLQNGGIIGSLALSLAAGRKNIEIVKFLLPYIERGYGLAFYTSLGRGNCQIANLIYQHAKSIDPGFPDDNLRELMYGYAVRSDNILCVRWLVENFGAPPEKVMKELMKDAMKTCNQEIIDYIMQF